MSLSPRAVRLIVSCLNEHRDRLLGPLSAAQDEDARADLELDISYIQTVIDAVSKMEGDDGRDASGIEWRLSAFGSDDFEVAFIVLTEEQAKALGAEADGAMYRIEAYVGAWRKGAIK